MAVVWVRIDDRLIHGQVVEGWLPFLKADRVAVICDAAAQDPTQRALMRLALPENVDLDVLTTAEVSGFMARVAGEAGRILVLAPGPREALAVVEAGAGIASINVGGLHFAAGRVMLGRVIYLSEEDRVALESIASRGVRLEGQAVPSDPKTDIGELLKSEP